MDGRTIALVVSALAQLRQARRQKPPLRSIFVGVVLVAIAALAAIAAITCALMALWTYALLHAGDIGAPLIVALVLIVIVAALTLATERLWSGRSGTAKANSASTGNHALLNEDNLREIAKLMRDNFGTLAIGAIVAGFVAGAGNKRSDRRES